MKRCQYCNSAIDENDKFCPFCGSKIESNENSNSDFTSTCMSCGAKLSKDDVYCRECGTINPFYEDVTVANTKANQENGYTNSENVYTEDRRTKYTGKNIWKTIPDFFKNYFNFSGRACRAEFWFPVLIIDILGGILIDILGAIFPFLIHTTTVTFIDFVYEVKYNYLSDFVSVITFIPWLSVTIRRLRDAGKSIASLLWIIIPFPGWIILLVFLVLPSESYKK